jgi:hypothetical protein
MQLPHAEQPALWTLNEEASLRTSLYVKTVITIQSVTVISDHAVRPVEENLSFRYT